MYQWLPSTSWCVVMKTVTRTQLYCNHCPRKLCEQCRNKHQVSPDTKNHEVVTYQRCKMQLPAEKCRDHPNKDKDILCQDCQDPICYKCAMEHHENHKLTIYSEKFTLCRGNEG